MISLVGAAFTSLGNFTTGENITLIQLCDDCTYNNISSIVYPNGTIALNEVEMTKSGTQYTYTLDGSYTSLLGTYIVNGFGDEGGSVTVWAYSFEITYAGIELTEGKAVVYVGLMGVLLFIFIITLFGINKLPVRNQRDEEGKLLSISYLKYFRDILWLFEWMLIITILYVSSNLAFAYLGEQLFAKILFIFFQIGLGLTPVLIVVWMIWIIVSMFHDKQLQALLNRGMMGGNL